jgi:7-carboxy-7-deazaguanine synthase
MFISEIYHSRQGEGFLAGTPSVFLRTSGCNLRCGFCDTPFASWNPEGQHQSVDQIVAAVRAETNKLLPPMDPKWETDLAVGDSAGQAKAPSVVSQATRHVVITGGEPMLAKEMPELCQRLSGSGFHLTIETAGTIDRQLPCDLMSISPKLSNSDPTSERAGPWLAKHQAARHRPEIVRALIERHDYQLKFVVDKPKDIEEIELFLAEVGDFDPQRVLLMPQGTELADLEQRESWLADVCDLQGFTLCRRLHILWYGNKRAT